MRPTMLVCIVVSLCFFVPSGCNFDSPNVPADEYDQSCSIDDDCTTVRAGDICDCGSPAAISKDALDDFNADKTQAAARCPRRLVCPNDWEPEALCVDETCELATAVRRKEG